MIGITEIGKIALTYHRNRPEIALEVHDGKVRPGFPPQGSSMWGRNCKVVELVKRWIWHLEVLASITVVFV